MSLASLRQFGFVREVVRAKRVTPKINWVTRKGIGKLVPAAGVEPATFRSGGERSNPLSYAGVN